MLLLDVPHFNFNQNFSKCFSLCRTSRMLIGIAQNEFCDHLSQESIRLYTVEVSILWNFSELIKCSYYFILRQDNRKHNFPNLFEYETFFFFNGGKREKLLRLVSWSIVWETVGSCSVNYYIIICQPTRKQQIIL